MSKVFVYGSLLRGCYNNHLLGDAAFTGNAVANGLLYEVVRDGFPGMVKGDGEVFGEVYEVDKDTLHRLDQLEGYHSSDKPNSHYLREEIPVACDDGKTVKAWAYFYNRPLRRYQHIPSGNWRDVARVHE